MHLVQYMGTDINPGHSADKTSELSDSRCIQPTIMKKLQNLKELRVKRQSKILLHKTLEIQNVDFLHITESILIKLTVSTEKKPPAEHFLLSIVPCQDFYSFFSPFKDHP